MTTSRPGTKTSKAASRPAQKPAGRHRSQQAGIEANKPASKPASRHRGQNDRIKTRHRNQQGDIEASTEASRQASKPASQHRGQNERIKTRHRKTPVTYIISIK